MTDLSFVTLTDFDTENPVVMQMLHVQQKIKLVPSHVDNNANSKCWNVQPMLTHRPDLLKDVPAFVDVHADMNPQRFDVLRFFFYNKLQTALVSEADSPQLRTLRAASLCIRHQF